MPADWPATGSRLVIGVLAVAAVGLGCGRAQRSPRSTERAAALVRLDGKPLADALVLLGPREGGYAAQGTTDAAGRARLTTFVPGDGAVAGRYRVLVSCEEVKPNPAVVLPDPRLDIERYRAALDAANAAGQTVYLRTQLLPSRYVAFATSGLVAEIKAGLDNVVTLDLSSAADATP